MPSLIVKIKTVSPLFLNGADKAQPELRAASVRGQLRYWFRAIEGAKTDSLQEVWRKEESIFGSTECGSQVSIRLYQQAELDVDESYLLPHRSERKSPQRAIQSNQIFVLELVSPLGLPLNNEAQNALLIWLMLGGLGKRSRRMFGAFDSNILGKNRPQSPEKLIQLLQILLPDILGKPSYLINQCHRGSVPSFPTLHPSHSRISVGKVALESATEANRKLFGILRSDEFRLKETIFGHTMGGRRASPLIAQVRKLGNDYYPVLTIMRSSDIKNDDWGILNKFMDKCESVFEGQTIWGGGSAK